MKIFSAAQIKQWDEYTIQHEPVTSILLMERAAAACCHWLLQHYQQQQFIVICGSGNNGGDGLAIARLLAGQRKKVMVYQLAATNYSPDCAANIQALEKAGIPLHLLNSETDFPVIDTQSLVIDALFGIGLNKPVQGLAALLINHLNRTAANIISIDLPSGLFADQPSAGNTIIQARHTLTFECYKLAMLLPENQSCCGKIVLLNIGLHPGYYQQTATAYHIFTLQQAQAIYKPRNAFAHKYHFGHALLYAGSTPMLGAAILAARACIKSGAGLVTVHTHANNSFAIQLALPEAMVSTQDDTVLLTAKKAAIGFGPGLLANPSNSQPLQQLLMQWKGPLVIDATGLQLLSSMLPILSNKPGTPAVLTPHTGEFEKLFGQSANDFESIKLALEKAATHHCYILLKGRYSFTACPDGKGYFNHTGNSGMATAGSGDVLTGIITGLLAQGYPPAGACTLGAWLHGAAGDTAAAEQSAEAMLASDIINCLGKAYQQINLTL
ncbi:MAG: hypothetical protein RL172_1194 [Bacteroidota bacterium]|jgi:NAD(P)H-hydrate epimerase